MLGASGRSPRSDRRPAVERVAFRPLDEAFRRRPRSACRAV